jgi:hypothetical protein
MSRSLVSNMYRLARLTNTASAIASGNPERMMRRGRNIVIGRAAARAGIWRVLWGRW